MKKIIIIVPYFGQLPSYFSEFYRSCIENRSVDFLFITDQNVELNTNNFFVWHTSFEKFREIIQHKFDFCIALERPYKLCDYKPAYGYVLQSYLKKYDFWGYCDIDVIFGNIRNFVTDSVLQNYDKVYQNGHLTLYKNLPEINRVFMNRRVGMDYKYVFQTNFISVFDEYDGIQKKFDLLNLKTYKANDFADISIKSAKFLRVNIADTNYKKLDNQIYIWNKGKLIEYGYIGDNLMAQEVAYIHFQKRKLKNTTKLNNLNEFIITKDGFKECTVRHISKPYIDANNSAGTIEQVLFRVIYLKYIWVRRIKKWLFRR